MAEESQAPAATPATSPPPPAAPDVATLQATYNKLAAEVAALAIEGRKLSVHLEAQVRTELKKRLGDFEKKYQAKKDAKAKVADALNRAQGLA